MQIAGISDALHNPSSHIGSFGVSRLRQKGDTRWPHQHWGVEPVVLPVITAPLPGFPVPFNHRWKNLIGLLANRDFSVAVPVHVLQGTNVFVCVILHGWQTGTSGTLSVLEMRFRWGVLRTTHPEYCQQQSFFCFSNCFHDPEIPISC